MSCSISSVIAQTEKENDPTVPTFNITWLVCFWGLSSSRRVTLASPAVRAAGGVNVGQLPSAQRAIRSPTAVPVARGPEAATASAASQDTGITVHPAARVSQKTKCSFSVCKLADRELEELVEEWSLHSCRNRMNSGFHSHDCSSTVVIRGECIKSCDP